MQNDFRRWMSLCEAIVEIERSKFWCNVNTRKILWFGGSEHHAHAIYIDPRLFGAAPEQVDHLANHPAMQDYDSEDDDPGNRIIYLPELFWQVMQHGWVRGGLEGEFNYDEFNRHVIRPHGLYLEGKSLRDLGIAARLVAEEVQGDPDDDWEDDDAWMVETLRLSVRAGPDRWDNKENYRLSGEQVPYFLKYGRIPSSMLG